MTDVIVFDGDDASQLVDLLGEIKREKIDPTHGHLRAMRVRTIDRISARGEEYFSMGRALPTHLPDSDPIKIANAAAEWIGRDNEVVIEREQFTNNWIITAGAERCIPNPCPRTIDSFTFRSTRSVIDIARESNGNVSSMSSGSVLFDFTFTADDVKPLSIAPYQEWHEGCTDVVTRNVRQPYGTACAIAHAIPARTFKLSIELPGTDPTSENEDGIVAGVWELIQCTPLTARLFLQEEIIGERNQTQHFFWDDERYITSNMTWRYRCTNINLNFAPGFASCPTAADIASGVQSQIRALSTTHPELAGAIVTVEMVDKPTCAPMFSNTQTKTLPDSFCERNVTMNVELTIYGRIYRLVPFGNDMRFSVWQYAVVNVTRVREINIATDILNPNGCAPGSPVWVPNTVTTTSGGWSQLYIETISCAEATTINRLVGGGRSYDFFGTYLNQLTHIAAPLQEINEARRFTMSFIEDVRCPDTLKYPAIVRPKGSTVEPLRLQSIVLKRGNWTVTLDSDADPTLPFVTASSFPLPNITRSLRSSGPGSRIGPDGKWQWSIECSGAPNCFYQPMAGVTQANNIRPYASLDFPSNYLAGVVFDFHVDSNGNQFRATYQAAITGHIGLYRCPNGWRWWGSLTWRLDQRFWRRIPFMLQMSNDPFGFEFANSQSVRDFNLIPFNDVTQTFNVNQNVTESTLFDEHTLTPLRQWPTGLTSNGLLTWSDAPATFRIVPRT